MKYITILCLLVVLVGCQSRGPLPSVPLTATADADGVTGDRLYIDPEIDYAPIFQVEDDDKHSRTRVFGPFLEDRQDADARRTTAFRPLFSRHEDFANEHISQDLFYPLLTYRLNGIRLIRNGFIGVSMDDNIYDEASPWQDYILPIYFNGRGKNGKRYFAIWPLGGVIRDVFSYSSIKFFLWPLWMKTVKGNDIVNYHVLWPILHKADGKYSKKRKVFPIIGYAEDYKKKWNSSFFLWPLFHWGYSLDQERQPGWAFGIFPLASYAKLEIPERNFSFYSWNFLFPFFMHAISTNSKKIHAPWPFFQYAKQTDKNGKVVGSRLYFWPFWGKDLKRGSKEMFLLYPLFFRYDRPIPDGRRKMTYLFIAFMHTKDTKNNGEWSSFSRIWPLLSYARDSKGNKHLKILDIFPLRNVDAIARNWSPIWTLYEFEANENWYSHDFLWGMVQFKKRRNGEVLDCSVFPLFNYEISGQEKIRKFQLLLGLYGSKVFSDGMTSKRYLWLWSHRIKQGELKGHGLFPLYNYQETSSGDVQAFSLLTGLYSRKKVSDTEGRSRYGWLVTRDYQNGKTVGHGVFPFYSHRNDGDVSEFNVLGGLWGRRKKVNGAGYNRLLWFFKINHTDPVKDDDEP